MKANAANQSFPENPPQKATSIGHLERNFCVALAQGIQKHQQQAQGVTALRTLQEILNQFVAITAD